MAMILSKRSRPNFATSSPEAAISRNHGCDPISVTARCLGNGSRGAKRRWRAATRPFCNALSGSHLRRRLSAATDPASVLTNATSARRNAGFLMDANGLGLGIAPAVRLFGPIAAIVPVVGNRGEDFMIGGFFRRQSPTFSRFELKVGTTCNYSLRAVRSELAAISSASILGIYYEWATAHVVVKPG
jgi:hypothetical protein